MTTAINIFNAKHPALVPGCVLCRVRSLRERNLMYSKINGLNYDVFELDSIPYTGHPMPTKIRRIGCVYYGQNCFVPDSPSKYRDLTELELASLEEGLNGPYPYTFTLEKPV